MYSADEIFKGSRVLDKRLNIDRDLLVIAKLVLTEII